jgi:two-component system, LytTR family, response regulator
MRVVPVAGIDYIPVGGAYAELHVGTVRHVVRESLQSLEEQLDPQCFVRIHRSTIVRVEIIETFHHAEGGDYHVLLERGPAEGEPPPA